MLEKVWFTQEKFYKQHHETVRVQQKSGQSMKKLELPWLKKVSQAGHFGNIFMKSSVMADILNRNNFYFTFFYNFRIL